MLVRQNGASKEESELARGSVAGRYSNLVIAVYYDACILCDRCVRACDDIQGNDVIGRLGKGYGRGSRSTSTTRWASRRA